MIFLEKFDYQKFYISNIIDELAEVYTSRFWVAQVWCYLKILGRYFVFNWIYVMTFYPLLF